MKSAYCMSKNGHGGEIYRHLKHFSIFNKSNQYMSLKGSVRTPYATAMNTNTIHTCNRGMSSWIRFHYCIDINQKIMKSVVSSHRLLHSTVYTKDYTGNKDASEATKDMEKKKDSSSLSGTGTLEAQRNFNTTTPPTTTSTTTTTTNTDTINSSNNDNSVTSPTIADLKSLVGAEENDKLRNLLEQDVLIVERKMELGQILIGWEVANLYEIKNKNNELLGYIAEKDDVKTTLMRNITTTHRSFTVHILDTENNELFRVRRPFFFFTSSMYIENSNQQIIGEVHQRWHPWRRKYDAYMDKKQIATIDEPILSTQFEMKDQNNQLLSSVSKDFTGFAREIFTDANRYVIRLDGSGESGEFSQTVHDFESNLPNTTSPVTTTTTTTMEKYREKLHFDKRAIAIATAVAVDFDYFSFTSHRPGILGSMLPIPIPTPSEGSSDNSSTETTATTSVNNPSSMMEPESQWDSTNDGSKKIHGYGYEKDEIVDETLLEDQAKSLDDGQSNDWFRSFAKDDGNDDNFDDDAADDGDAADDDDSGGLFSFFGDDSGDD